MIMEMKNGRSYFFEQACTSSKSDIWRLLRHTTSSGSLTNRLAAGPEASTLVVGGRSESGLRAKSETEQNMKPRIETVVRESCQPFLFMKIKACIPEQSSRSPPANLICVCCNLGAG